MEARARVVGVDVRQTGELRQSVQEWNQQGTEKKTKKKDEPMEAYKDVSLHDRRITVSRKLLERLCTT